MEYALHHVKCTKVTELLPKEQEISNPQDVLDIMMEAAELGSYVVIIHESSLPEGFFKLATGIAGEIAQKAANYQFQLLIIGDFDKFDSIRLNEYIRESNRGTNVNFYGSREEALKAVYQQP